MIGQWVVNADDRQCVDTMMTERSLAYHQGLIRKGQIARVREEPPSAILEDSRRNTLGYGGNI